MPKQELSIEDQMDVIEASFYKEAAGYKAAKAVVAAAVGLGDLSRARVSEQANLANINYILDKWLDLKLELGDSVKEVEYDLAA